MLWSIQKIILQYFTDVKLYFITQQAYAKLLPQEKATVMQGEKLIYRDKGEYKVGLVPLRVEQSQSRVVDAEVVEGLTGLFKNARIERTSYVG